MALRFTLRLLEYLITVADCWSVALAAAKVNVSSPSISAAIGQLEASFGLQLFVRRHAQGLSLTEGGRQFTATAREVLAPHPMVLLDMPFSAAYFLSLFANAGLSPAIAERTRDMGVMRAMVANGFGYSIANIRLGPDRAPDGRRLVFVPLVGDVRPMRIGLLLPGSGKRRRIVARFVDHCRTALTDAALPGLYGDAT